LSTDLRKNPHISSIVKIHPVGPELFGADERTDKQKTDRETDRRT